MLIFDLNFILFDVFHYELEPQLYKLILYRYIS